MRAPSITLQTSINLYNWISRPWIDFKIYIQLPISALKKAIINHWIFPNLQYLIVKRLLNCHKIDKMSDSSKKLSGAEYKKGAAEKSQKNVDLMSKIPKLSTFFQVPQKEFDVNLLEKGLYHISIFNQVLIFFLFF